MWSVWPQTFGFGPTSPHTLLPHDPFACLVCAMWCPKAQAVSQSDLSGFRSHWLDGFRSVTLLCLNFL